MTVVAHYVGGPWDGRVEELPVGAVEISVACVPLSSMHAGDIAKTIAKALYRRRGEQQTGDIYYDAVYP